MRRTDEPNFNRADGVPVPAGNAGGRGPGGQAEGAGRRAGWRRSRRPGGRRAARRTASGRTGAAASGRRRKSLSSIECTSRIDERPGDCRAFRILMKLRPNDDLVRT